MAKTKIIGKGELYLFYRTKMDVDVPEGLDDIARLHLILMPAGASKGRMFVIGKKRLPEIIKGKSKSEEREWMMNTGGGDTRGTGRSARPHRIRDKDARKAP